MPNWLTKATGGSARESSDAPQEFQLTCECSEQHTGQRKARPQRIICQSCGTALFVLPKNVYPALKVRSATKKKRGRKLTRSGPPTGRRLPSANQMSASIRSGVIGAAGGLGRGVGSAATAARRRMSTSAASAGRAVRSSLTPFRVVVIGMALMLLATAVVALRSRSLETARKTLRTESAAGQASLTEEDRRRRTRSLCTGRRRCRPAGNRRRPVARGAAVLSRDARHDEPRCRLAVRHA